MELKDDVGKCENGCDYEGHCFTINRFDGYVLICPECFFDYLPSYHQDSILKIASRKLAAAQIKREYEEEHARRVKVYGGEDVS